MSALSNNLLALDEPSERLKRRTNMDLTPPNNKRRAMPTCLNQLDALTLSHIFDKLTTKELLPLLCLGNWLLTTKITTQLKSLNFNYQTLRLILPWKKENIIQWRWPQLLTQPLPHLTHLNVDYRVLSAVTARLDVLPISLTQLSLSNCLICVESLHQVIFNLPLLNVLNISLVSVNQIGHGLQMPVCDDQWLIPSIQHSPLLTHVAYRMGDTPSFNSLKTIASLASLEFLSIPHFLIEEACWPFQLSSLQLFNEGEVVSMPSTITRLQLPSWPKQLETILAMTPETLLHFEMPVTPFDWSDRLIPSICRFRHLQTLNLIRDGLFERDEFDVGDLSCLPNTINLVSFMFATKSSQWQYLPPNIKFVSANATTYRRFRDMPSYNALTDAEHLPHFPRNLHHMAMIDCLVPMEMPCLTRVHFDMMTMDLPTTHACLLTNLPPVLTTLTISSQTSLMSFDGIGVAKRLPRLTTLCLNVASLHNWNVILPWLESVPISLTHLGLKTNYAQKNANDVAYVELLNIVFPPKLRLLDLDVGNMRLDLPITLPSTIYSVDIRGLYIVNSHNLIAQWPLGLRNVTVTSTDNNYDVRYNNDVKIQASTKVLLHRIKAKFGQSVSMNRFPSLSYQ